MSDTPVFSLVERRKPVEAPWSPEELVATFLDEIRAGKTKPVNLMVFFCEADEEGRLTPHTWTANLSATEVIAFCQLESQRAIEIWRR